MRALCLSLNGYCWTNVAHGPTAISDTRSLCVLPDPCASSVPGAGTGNRLEMWTGCRKVRAARYQFGTLPHKSVDSGAPISNRFFGVMWAGIACVRIL